MGILEKSIKNKVVIVTGGTRGIGFSTVKSFLENGAKVALCGSREETVNKALEKLKEINSDFEVLGFSTDLLNIEDIKKMMDEVENKWGKIDVLINNAGISDNVSIYDQDDKHF